MANQKISDLTDYSSPLDADLVPIVETATGITKKITWANITAFFNSLYAGNSGAAIRSLLGISTLSGSNTGDQTISDATISTSDITTNNVSTSKHGFAPKLPNDATKYLDGTGAYSVPPGSGGGSGDVVGPSSATDNAIARFDSTTGKLIQNSAATVADTTGDITAGKYNTVAISGSSTPTLAVTGTTTVSGSNTGDQTSTAGLSNTTNKNLITDAQLTVLGNTSGTNTGDQTISDATISISDITTNNASTSKHGFVPKLPNDATKYYDGTGAYSVPTNSTVATGGVTTHDISLTTTTTIAHGLGQTPTVAKITGKLGDSNGICIADSIITSGGTVSTTGMNSFTQGTGITDATFTLTTTGSGNKLTGTLSMDGTNITITWNKTGSPAGTAQILWSTQS